MMGFVPPFSDRGGFLVLIGFPTFADVYRNYRPYVNFRTFGVTMSSMLKNDIIC